MTTDPSPKTGKHYPVAVVCKVLHAPRSTVYAQRVATPTPKAKRGPKTVVSDEALLAAIKEVLAENAFPGEGHKKVRIRLRNGRWQIKGGKHRILRLMREHGLLAPVRRVHAHGSKAHDGTIVTDRPDELWGADATLFGTEEDGPCWFFGVVDHFNSECIGFQVAQRGTRWTAIESLRNAVRLTRGAIGPQAAQGLAVRHDWGPQYTARDFRLELAFLGIASSPAYVGEPETNGVAERFMRTLKEHCIYLHRFKNLAEAQAVIAEFVAKYNREWIVARLGYRSPSQARSEYLAAQSVRSA